MLGAAIALLLVATGCYLGATRIMDGLFAYTSPLNEVSIPLGEPISPQPSERRLVFVLVDGLRVDTATDPALMPTLARLREQGASRVLHSRAPSYSAPGWTVLGTGSWPSLNGGEAMNPEGTDPLLWQQDHIFAAANDARLRSAISGNDWWRSMLPPQTWVESYFTRGEDTAADDEVVEQAVRWLNDDLTDLLLVDLNGVDDAGHNHGGPDGLAWPIAARAADDQISRIVDTLDLSRDTLLVVSDHGHIGPGGHGGTEKEVVTEPLLLVGGPIKPGTYPDADQIDVAPTVATILGTRLPAASELRTLTTSASPQAQNVFLPGQRDTNGRIDRPVRDRTVTNLYHNRVDKDRRINTLQRPVDPLDHLLDHLVGNPADGFFGHARAIDLVKVCADLTGRQTFGIQRQHHLIDPGQTPLAFLHNLRCERPVTIPGSIDRHLLRRLG